MGQGSGPGCRQVRREKREGQCPPSPLYAGSSTWTRTRDLRINSPTLYQLSYRGTALDYIGSSASGKVALALLSAAKHRSDGVGDDFHIAAIERRNADAPGGEHVDGKILAQTLRLGGAQARIGEHPALLADV